MRRSVFVLLVLQLAWLPLLAQEPAASQKQATLAYLQSLQKDNGAFATDKKAETPGTLAGTSSGLRAIKYFGGTVKNKEACAQYVRSCRDLATGGFAPTPGGKPDVRTTAIGIMAAKELGGIKFDDDLKGAVAFLATNAKSFEDMRIAAAGFEASTLPEQDVVTKWMVNVGAMRNADGTFGQGGNVARDTGSAVVTLLRLGDKIEQPEKALKTLQAGQLSDGGWVDGATSDLETTYRVMRAFKMLKGRPDVAKCRDFVAKCRNNDGSYGLQPGQPGNISATYFAGVVLHWMEDMSAK